jgi:CRISPR-associated protein Cst2
MRNTQMPHLVNFEGVITYSTGPVPAPTISPLNENFKEEIEKVATALNGLHPDTVTVKPFESLADFAQTMQELIKESVPYQLVA